MQIMFINNERTGTSSYCNFLSKFPLPSTKKYNIEKVTHHIILAKGMRGYSTQFLTHTDLNAFKFREGDN